MTFLYPLFLSLLLTYSHVLARPAWTGVSRSDDPTAEQLGSLVVVTTLTATVPAPSATSTSQTNGDNQQTNATQTILNYVLATAGAVLIIDLATWRLWYVRKHGGRWFAFHTWSLSRVSAPSTSPSQEMLERHSSHEQPPVLSREERRRRGGRGRNSRRATRGPEVDSNGRRLGERDPDVLDPGDDGESVYSLPPYVVYTGLPAYSESQRHRLGEGTQSMSTTALADESQLNVSVAEYEARSRAAQGSRATTITPDCSLRPASPPPAFSDIVRPLSPDSHHQSIRDSSLAPLRDDSRASSPTSSLVTAPSQPQTPPPGTTLEGLPLAQR